MQDLGFHLHHGKNKNKNDLTAKIGVCWGWGVGGVLVGGEL